MLFILVACSNSEQNATKNGSEKSQEVNVAESEKPPSVTITFDEEVVKTKQGGYSWNYLDSKTGEMIGIEAESLPAKELVSIEDAISVNLNESVTLNIKKEALHYEIRVYS